MHLLDLLMDDMWSQYPVRSHPISVDGDLFGQIEDEGHGECVISSRELYQRLPILRPNIGGVHKGEFSRFQALRHDEMKDFERTLRRRQVVLVIRDQRPTKIRRNNLG